MAKKKKAAPDPEVESKPVPSHKVSFDSWFKKAKKKYRLRDHQDYALQVFFEKQGLTQMEDPEKYDEMIAKF